MRGAYDQLGALHRRLESAKEEERAFLARELHDEMGQSLTALKLRLQLLMRTAGQAAANEAAPVLGLVDGLIAHVRKISADLRPPLLDEIGLDAALRAFIDSQAARNGLQLTVHTQGLEQRCSTELQRACFRIVQEAVTNAIRHAQASRVDVRVALSEGQLQIVIEDDGRGLSSEEVARKANAGHLGLVGMRERVRLLGGELSLSSTRSDARTGGCVRVVLPTVPALAQA